MSKYILFWFPPFRLNLLAELCVGTPAHLQQLLVSGLLNGFHLALPFLAVYHYCNYLLGGGAFCNGQQIQVSATDLVSVNTYS